MPAKLKAKPSVRLTVEAATAADLMTPNPASIRDAATVSEAIRFLTGKGFSAAPVIDSAGRPVGVLSRADILVHEREREDSGKTAPEYYDRFELTSSSTLAEPAVSGATLVRDIMTPAVFSVGPETSTRRVIEDMVALKVHRLFVVDTDGILVGVISALDILRHLSF